MMNEPCILTETANGFQRSTLLDEALARREIELYGDIDTPTAMSVIRQLRYLAGQDGNMPITMLINSGGGEVVAGLAIYDTMRALPCPVLTVCVGEAASMAALLFAAGSHRSILPSAYVMVHDPLLTGCGGTALSVDAIAARLMRVRRQVAEILARHTGHSVEDVLEKTMRDTYFDANEAVAWGLADEVLTAWGGIADAG